MTIEEKKFHDLGAMVFDLITTVLIGLHSGPGIQASYGGKVINMPANEERTAFHSVHLFIVAGDELANLIHETAQKRYECIQVEGSEPGQAN